jgi:hypothetical protein
LIEQSDDCGANVNPIIFLARATWACQVRVRVKALVRVRVR